MSSETAMVAEQCRLQRMGRPDQSKRQILRSL